jgi:hypothetical protein
MAMRVTVNNLPASGFCKDPSRRVRRVLKSEKEQVAARKIEYAELVARRDELVAKYEAIKRQRGF